MEKGIDKIFEHEAFSLFKENVFSWKIGEKKPKGYKIYSISFRDKSFLFSMKDIGMVMFDISSEKIVKYSDELFKKYGFRGCQKTESGYFFIVPKLTKYFLTY